MIKVNGRSIQPSFCSGNYDSGNPKNSWDKVFQNGPSKISGRQPLKNLKDYGLLKQTMPLQIFQRVSSTNFTWSVLEYFILYNATKGFSVMYK